MMHDPFWPYALLWLGLVILAVALTEWALSYLNPLPETVEQGAEDGAELVDVSHYGDGF